MRSTHHTKQFLRAGLLTLAMLLMASALAGSAAASTKDRNHDGIPDRWEKKHHLSLKVSQANRDQDRDGVNNTCEQQAKMNPHRKDSNRNGVRDGAEDRDGDGISNGTESTEHSACNATDTDHDGVGDANENSGTVVSFTGGVLTIKTGTDSAGADVLVTGTVTDATKIECHTAGEHHGCDGDGGTPQATAAHDHGEDGGDQEDDDVNAAACSAADLIPGAVIHEATLVDGAFTKIEIAK